MRTINTSDSYLRSENYTRRENTSTSTISSKNIRATTSHILNTLIYKAFDDLSYIYNLCCIEEVLNSYNWRIVSTRILNNIKL